VPKFKLGLLIGAGIGWAVGSGRAAEFWNQFQQSMMHRDSHGTPSAPKHNAFERGLDEAMEASDRTVASA
jgi:hypothetical protein